MTEAERLVLVLVLYLLGWYWDSCRLLACCMLQGKPCRIHPLQLQSTRLRRASRTGISKESGTEHR